MVAGAGTLNLIRRKLLQQKWSQKYCETERWKKDIKMKERKEERKKKKNIREETCAAH
jgi:hypothetical protein